MDTELSELRRHVIDQEDVIKTLQQELARLQTAQVEATTSVSTTTSSSEGTPRPARRSRGRFYFFS